MAPRKRSGGRRYPRTARLNELFREILGEEIERSDDERLALVTVMGVEVQRDLERATVYWSSVMAAGDEALVQQALEEARPRLQRAIGVQARVRRVPELVFRPDPTVPQAERIEGILRDLRSSEDAGGDEDAGGPAEG